MKALMVPQNSQLLDIILQDAGVTFTYLCSQFPKLVCVATDNPPYGCGMYIADENDLPVVYSENWDHS